MLKMLASNTAVTSATTAAKEDDVIVKRGQSMKSRPKSIDYVIILQTMVARAGSAGGDSENGGGHHGKQYTAVQDCVQFI